MTLKVYSIFDAAANAYMQPHFAHTHGLMRRMFADAVNDPQSNLNKHPKDYRLYYIGDFDDETGELTHAPHELLNGAADFITKES